MESHRNRHVGHSTVPDDPNYCEVCAQAYREGLGDSEPTRTHHYQWDGPWFPAWIGWSFGSFYLGVSVMPESGFTVGLGFVYLGIGRYDRGWR